MDNSIVQYREIKDGIDLEAKSLDADKNVIGDVIFSSKSVLRNLLISGNIGSCYFSLHEGAYSLCDLESQEFNQESIENYIDRISCFEVDAKVYFDSTSFYRTQEQKYRFSKSPSQIRKYNKQLLKSGSDHLDKQKLLYPELHNVLEELQGFVLRGYVEKYYLQNEIYLLSEQFDPGTIRQGLEWYPELKNELLSKGIIFDE